MTDEEINRKFDTVAGHLATLAVGLETLREQVGRISDKFDRTADGITSLLAIAEIHDREIAELAESVKVVDERTRRTDERLDALITTVERIISERQNGKGGTPE
jgi:methyl-accepting chemotaxis protein